MAKKDVSHIEAMSFGYGVVIGQLQHIDILVKEMLDHQWLGNDKVPRELITDISKAIEKALENLIMAKIQDVGELHPGFSI
jgi:hypothetical protein